MSRKSRRDSCRVVNGDVSSFDKSAWAHKRRPIKAVDVSHIHVRSYKADEPMPKGFNMGAVARVVMCALLLLCTQIGDMMHCSDGVQNINCMPIGNMTYCS